jgi:hypothetical protein
METAGNAVCRNRDDEDGAGEVDMLDAYVIEEIKRRDRDRSRDDRPVVELPLPPATPPGPGRKDDDREDDRGVVIIDYSG